MTSLLKKTLAKNLNYYKLIYDKSDYISFISTEKTSDFFKYTPSYFVLSEWLSQIGITNMSACKVEKLRSSWHALKFG